MSETQEEIHQRLFNKAALHLLKQRAKSERRMPNTEFLGCAYRGAEGRMCAIGCLIPQRTYRVAMEDKNLVDLLRLFKIKTLEGADPVFLEDIQYLHDRMSPEQWQAGLEDVAARHELTLPW